jgi:23S rRNA pseudouridine1911/1915/1917 synthase
MSGATTRRWVVQAGEEGPLRAIVERAGGDEAAIAEGRVFVGRRRARREDEPVVVGEEVAIAPRPPAAIDVRILASEDGIVAADKPAGMPTIPDQSGAAHSLLAAVARAVGVPPARLHPTSRLDRDVSGVVVFASSTLAKDRLKRARALGVYARRYLAIASRAPSPEAGRWDDPIGRAPDPRKRMVSGRDATSACSHFATIERTPLAALLALTPITGRTHQLRVHAGHAGAPLLGDRDYGGLTRLTLPGGRVLALRRIALHAARVTVPRADGGSLIIESPVPADLRDLWAAVGGAPAAWQDAIGWVDDFASPA